MVRGFALLLSHWRFCNMRLRVLSIDIKHSQQEIFDEEYRVFAKIWIQFIGVELQVKPLDNGAWKLLLVRWGHFWLGSGIKQFEILPSSSSCSQTNVHTLLFHAEVLLQDWWDLCIKLWADMFANCIVCDVGEFWLRKYTCLSNLVHNIGDSFDAHTFPGFRTVNGDFFIFLFFFFMMLKIIWLVGDKRICKVMWYSTLKFYLNLILPTCFFFFLFMTSDFEN